MRTWQKAIVVIVILYAAIAGATLAVMYQPPERFGQVMKHVPDIALVLVPFKPLWFVARAGRLQAGDPAPNFALETQDQKSIVRLASFQGARPVVLVFGSYT